jgi:hypothetical protein
VSWRRSRVQLSHWRTVVPVRHLKHRWSFTTVRVVVKSSDRGALDRAQVRVIWLRTIKFTPPGARSRPDGTRRGGTSSSPRGRPAGAVNFYVRRPQPGAHEVPGDGAAVAHKVCGAALSCA